MSASPNFNRSQRAAELRAREVEDEARQWAPTYYETIPPDYDDELLSEPDPETKKLIAKFMKRYNNEDQSDAGI